MRTVVALGGNALTRKGKRGTYKELVKNINNVTKKLIPLFKNQLVITLGSGPQIGSILIQTEKSKSVIPAMPLHVLDAELEGELGYLVETSISNLKKKQAITLITRVLVSKTDKAFKNPTKFIGPYYNKKPSVKKIIFKKDPRGGYRRVVPSPKPLKIIEKDAIKKLLKKYIVIAAGGGGIPVYKSHNKLHGIDAVIDKDLASSLLASSINASLLIILTDVPCVYLNYKKKSQKPLNKVTLKQLKVYLKQSQFPPGSMGPKIQAAINFLSKKGKKVIIANPENLQKALNGISGTIITK